MPPAANILGSFGSLLMTLSLLSAICTREMSTLGAASSGRCEGGKGVPSREDRADEGVAGGGGDELEEGPDGYRNLGLLLLAPLLPLSLRTALESAAGEAGGMLAEGDVVLLPGLLRPSLSLYKAADDARLLVTFPLDFA